MAKGNIIYNEITTSSEIDSISKKTGQLLFTTDTKKLFLDNSSSSRIEIAPPITSLNWDNITNKPSTFTPSSHTHDSLFFEDARAIATTPSNYSKKFRAVGLKENATIGISDAGTYSGLIGFWQWANVSGGHAHELAFNNNGLYHRIGTSETTWGSWVRILNSGNYSSYALPLTGGTITGTLNVTNTITSTNGYLVASTYGKTIQIGSQNNAWCHYATTAPSHWFNTNVAVNGNIYHGSNYNIRVPLITKGTGNPSGGSDGDVYIKYS